MPTVEAVLSLKSAYGQQVENLFRNGRERTYGKNQLIHYQGDSLTHFYLVEEGFIKAYTILEAGDTRTLFLLSPGDIFPIVFSITLDWEKYHLKYFYQTLSAIKLKVIDRHHFQEMIDGDMSKMQTYVTYLAASNQAALNQLEVMKNKKALNKVELLLPYLVMKLGQKPLGGKCQLVIKLSHKELADLCGVTRETTTSLIRQLEKKGVLKQTEGYLVINTDKLEFGPFEEE